MNLFLNSIYFLLPLAILMVPLMMCQDVDEENLNENEMVSWDESWEKLNLTENL